MYLDRDQVAEEQCKQWFLPVDDNLMAGEIHYCRNPAAFVEITTAKKIKRIHKKGKVVGYAETLFDEDPEGLTLVHRPEPEGG